VIIVRPFEERDKRACWQGRENAGITPGHVLAWEGGKQCVNSAAQSSVFAGMLVFGLASLGAGLSSGLMMLNLFRLLQGAGCAVLYTVTAAILVNAVPE